jgi:hypothetical protein
VTPVSFLSEYLYSDDIKCVGHLQIVDPTQHWPKLKIRVETKVKIPGSNSMSAYANVINGT